MIAVLMMFKNEEDILGQCVSHWRHLGVDQFYLCDNGSTDRSVEIVKAQLKQMNCSLFHCEYENFPQREMINKLKTMAIQDGHQWLFPIDADEFLCLDEIPANTINQWIKSCYDNFFYAYGQYRYKNIMPNGVSWFEPEHTKVFGRLNPGWNISIGNHEVEGVAPYLPHLGAYLNHYQYRSYEQFKRKKLTFFKAFERAGYLDHKFVKQYRLYQKHGEAYLEQMWDNLLRGVTEFEFKP